jgi:hypothetical protein
MSKEKKEEPMLNMTTEKGVFIGESPHMILSTNESLNGPSSETHEGPIEDFVLDERSEAGTLFITPIRD